MVDRIYDAVTGRGQLSERSVIVPCGHQAMDAIFLRGNKNPNVLVVPSLDTGATMSSPLANEFAYSAAYAGYASLRFSWRGTGASEGEFPHGDKIAPQLLEDLHAATDHMRETVEVPGLCFAVLRDSAELMCEFAKDNLRPRDLIVFVQPPDSILQQLPDCQCFAMFPGEQAVNPAFMDAEGIHTSRIPLADKHWRRGLGALGKRFTTILQTQ